MRPTLTVGTYNIESFTWRPGTGHHFGPALHHIARCTPTPPDVFALSEARYAGFDGQRPMWEFTNALSDMLPTGETYRPFWAPSPGRANPPLLLLNTAKVDVLRWWAPGEGGVRKWGFAETRPAGTSETTWISAIHWQGGLGRAEFEREAARLASHSQHSTLIAGDFNATSSWNGEVSLDWPRMTRERGEKHKLLQKARWSRLAGRWVLDTEQIDLLREVFDFWDFGERAGDPTVTTGEHGSGLRIDRIMASAPFPFTELLSYQVFREDELRTRRTISDHDYVHAEVQLGDQP
ncbi:endonuclease/exonuclease/phosphatase family protein [Saccharopolyspora cebuensis]|uniref:Endonuclease/exonuclease/phosphatase family protein n=1 Tax=Saccharopolyspora cebuensis TaxID=418759 RepID=A0ABV4CM61_9PSEU